MAKVRAFSLAGKTVNVPHSEYRLPEDRNAVTFDSDGFATVSDLMANSLVQFYPTQIELVEAETSATPSAAKKSKK